MNTKGLAQLTGMRFIPVSCANYLIISRISATATVVGSCETILSFGNVLAQADAIFASVKRTRHVRDHHFP